MKKIFCVLLVFIMTLSLFCGCGNTDEVSTPAVSSDVSSADTSSDPEPEEEKPDEELYNFITGEYSLSAPSETLPLGVMICNDTYTKSQPGLEAADMYVETETEGGITRIMACFADASRVPALLGPLRSGRTPFIQLTRALGFVYVHAGGSPKALQMVKLSDVRNIDVLKGGINTVRDSALQSANNGKWDHCLAMKQSAAVSGMKKQFGTKYDRQMPWIFSGESDTLPGEGATEIDIKVSASSNSASGFRFDEETKTYKKYKGTLASNKKHLSADKTQIEVSNIVVLFADKFVEQVEKYTRINFNLEKGSSALVFSNGTVREAEYKYETTGLSMFEKDGSMLRLSTGKTYVYIIANAYKNQVRYSSPSDTSVTE